VAANVISNSADVSVIAVCRSGYYDWLDRIRLIPILITALPWIRYWFKSVVLFPKVKSHDEVMHKLCKREKMYKLSFGLCVLRGLNALIPHWNQMGKIRLLKPLEISRMQFVSFVEQDRVAPSWN
jgi:hypothetical protein